MSAFDTIREALVHYGAKASLAALAEVEADDIYEQYLALQNRLAEVEAERDTRTRQLALVKETLTTRTTTLRERAEKAEATVARQGEALRRVQSEEINGRLCPRPESAEDRCCPSCRETWAMVDAAFAGSDVPPADTGEPLPARHADGHYDTCAIRAGASCDCPGAREDGAT